jgi:hypothetical protein
MTYRWSVFSGLALLIGATLIAVKSVAILATGDQPPLLFEISPFFLALGVLGLAPALALTGARRRVVPVLGAFSLVGAVVAVVTELTGEVLGAALAAGTLAAIAGTLVSGWRPGGDQAKRALVLIAVAVIPTMLIGGVLSAINERLLEVGLLGYALVWAWAGLRLVARRSPLGP